MASIIGNGAKGHHKFTLEVTENSTNISNNTSTISFAFKLSPIQTSWAWEMWGSSISYSININGTIYSGTIPNYDGYATVTLKIGSQTISHNADGSKSISFSFSVTDGANQYYTCGNASASGSMALTTIPRASKINSFSGNDIEGNFSVNYTSYYSGFTNKLRLSIPNVIVIQTIDNYASGSSIKLSTDTINYLYAYMKNSNSVQIGAVIETYNGSTKIGESEEIVNTCSITDANPIAGSLTYKDSNSFTTTITEDNQRIIRYNSNLVFTIGQATARKGASIVNYEITFNERTLSRTSEGDLDFGTINLSSSSNAILKVTDSRGNVATKEIKVIIDDWIIPTGIITLNRKNNFYSETYLKVDGTYSSLNGKNSMYIQYQYKKVSEKNFSELYNLDDNVQAILDLDNNYQWNVIVVVGDRIGQMTYNLFVDRGMPIIFFDRLLSSVGINCFPTKEKSIEIDGDAEAHNIAEAGGETVDSFNNVNVGEALNKSGIYSVNQDNNWYNLINIRHRNGRSDGYLYGMQIMNYMTADNQKLRFRQQVNGVWGDWRNIQEEPVVLYDGLADGSEGTTEEVTLSASSRRFNYLEIFLTKDEESGIWSVKTPSPHGRTVQVGTQYYAAKGNALQIIGKTIFIYDNKITHNTEFYINFNNSTGAIAGIGGQKTVKILKVIGWR